MAAAASVITYRDKGILDLNEDELERQWFIDDLFAGSGSEPNFERFPASERVKSSNSEDDSALEADAESFGELQMGGLDDPDAAAAYQTDPNLPVAETNRYYDQMVDALGGLDNLPPGSRLRNLMPADLPSIKAFLAILIVMGIVDWTFTNISLYQLVQNSILYNFSV